MTVIRRSEVENDIDSIAEYIGQRNPSAAIRFLDALRDTFSLLAQFPKAGPAVVVPDDRITVCAESRSTALTSM